MKIFYYLHYDEIFFVKLNLLNIKIKQLILQNSFMINIG
jgi:hypothetical protein